MIEAPFATVPSTGSIGEAAVQEFPCGVTDDCLLLFPKDDTPFEALYVAAATLRHERWRFNYGRKMTPTRIANFPLRLDRSLVSWVREQWEQANSLGQQGIEAFAPEEIEMPKRGDEKTEVKGGVTRDEFFKVLGRIKKTPPKQ